MDVGPRERWNQVHTFGLTDDHDHPHTGPPRQELSQGTLIPAPRKIAGGTSDSKSGAEAWLAGRPRGLQRGVLGGTARGPLPPQLPQHLEFLQQTWRRSCAHEGVLVPRADNRKTNT